MIYLQFHFGIYFKSTSPYFMRYERELGDCLLSHCEIWPSHNSDYKDEFLLRCDTACLSKNLLTSQKNVVDCILNVMAHTQKPDFIFRWNVRVHLNRRGRQFSWMLAAGVCASAVIMLYTPCYKVVWRVLATLSIRQFPLHFPSRASSHFNQTVPSSLVLKCWQISARVLGIISQSCK
jgi:hypothetical protein